MITRDSGGGGKQRIVVKRGQDRITEIGMAADDYLFFLAQPSLLFNNIFRDSYLAEVMQL